MIEFYASPNKILRSFAWMHFVYLSFFSAATCTILHSQGKYSIYRFAYLLSIISYLRSTILLLWERRFSTFLVWFFLNASAKNRSFIVLVVISGDAFKYSGLTWYFRTSTTFTSRYGSISFDLRISPLPVLFSILFFAFCFLQLQLLLNLFSCKYTSVVWNRNYGTKTYKVLLLTMFCREKSETNVWYRRDRDREMSSQIQRFTVSMYIYIDTPGVKNVKRSQKVNA